MWNRSGVGPGDKNVLAGHCLHAQSLALTVSKLDSNHRSIGFAGTSNHLNDQI